MNLDLTSSADLARALLPELVLTAAALLVLLVTAWRHTSARDQRIAGWTTVAGLAAAGAAVWWLWWHTARAAGAPSLIAVDDFRFVTDGLFLAAAGLTVLVSFDYLEREGLLVPEDYVLLLFATLGMMLMAGGGDDVGVFLSPPPPTVGGGRLAPPPPDPPGTASCFFNNNNDQPQGHTPGP